MSAPNITGDDILIYRKDDNYGAKYSIKLNRFNKGAWQNHYVQVQLPLETQLANETKISIKSGYLSFFPSKSGNQLKIVITDFEVVGETVGEINIPEMNEGFDELGW